MCSHARTKKTICIHRVACSYIRENHHYISCMHLLKSLFCSVYYLIQIFPLYLHNGFQCKLLLERILNIVDGILTSTINLFQLTDYFALWKALNRWMDSGCSQWGKQLYAKGKRDSQPTATLDRTWKKCCMVDADGDELKNSFGSAFLAAYWCFPWSELVLFAVRNGAFLSVK